MQKTLSWQAHEYKHYEKNLGWYVVAISVTVLAAAYFALVQNDYFGALTLAVLALVALLFSRKKPGLVEIELNEKGIRLATTEIPYKQIKYFWVVNNQKHKTLNLETTTLFNNLVIIELGEQDGAEVENFLSRFLPEHEETQETLSQRVSHWLKF